MRMSHTSVFFNHRSRAWRTRLITCAPFPSSPTAEGSTRWRAISPVPEPRRAWPESGANIGPAGVKPARGRSRIRTRANAPDVRPARGGGTRVSDRARGRSHARTTWKAVRKCKKKGLLCETPRIGRIGPRGSTRIRRATTARVSSRQERSLSEFLCTYALRRRAPRTVHKRRPPSAPTPSRSPPAPPYLPRSRPRPPPRAPPPRRAPSRPRERRRGIRRLPQSQSRRRRRERWRSHAPFL